RHRILAGLVPESARGVPLAARPDAALLRVVLAAPRRIQSAQPRIGLSRCGRRGAEIARPRYQEDRTAQHPELCDGGDRRSGHGYADRGRGSPAGLLRDGVLIYPKSAPAIFASSCLTDLLHCRLKSAPPVTPASTPLDTCRSCSCVNARPVWRKTRESPSSTS